MWILGDKKLAGFVGAACAVPCGPHDPRVDTGAVVAMVPHDHGPNVCTDPACGSPRSSIHCGGVLGERNGGPRPERPAAAPDSSIQSTEPRVRAPPTSRKREPSCSQPC